MTASALDQALFLHATCHHLRVPGQALLALLWRPLLASLVMCARILDTVPPGSGKTLVIGRMGLGIAAGALCYAVVLALAWLAAGRPNTAEADVQDMLRRTPAWLRGRLGRA